MSVVDLNFVTDGTLDRVLRRRNHHAEVLRECFKHSIERIHNDVEAMTDYCREMVKHNIDATEELKDAETTIKAMLLVVLLLKREQNGVE